MTQDKHTEQVIKDAVTRFLGWKLPATFNPDGGISYDPNVCETLGTHLFTAQEAEEMVRYILGDSLTTTRQQAREEVLREVESLPYPRDMYVAKYRYDVLSLIKANQKEV